MIDYTVVNYFDSLFIFLATNKSDFDIIADHEFGDKRIRATPKSLHLGWQRCSSLEL